jgi:hypothetical protein
MPVNLQEARRLNLVSKAMKEAVHYKNRKLTIDGLCENVDYCITNHLDKLPHDCFVTFSKSQCESVLDELRNLYPEFSIEIINKYTDPSIVHLVIDVKEEFKHVLSLPINTIVPKEEPVAEKPKPWHKKVLDYFQLYINMTYNKF